MRYHQITIEDTGERFACGEHESVLVGMARLGRRGIPVGCRGGGCGVCKIEIVRGDHTRRVMSRDHVSDADLAAGRVLACRVFPTGDLVLRVLGAPRRLPAPPAPTNQRS